MQLKNKHLQFPIKRQHLNGTRSNELKPYLTSPRSEAHKIAFHTDLSIESQQVQNTRTEKKIKDGLTRWQRDGEEVVMPVRIHAYYESNPAAERDADYPAFLEINGQLRTWTSLEEVEAELGDNYVLLKRHKHHGGYINLADAARLEKNYKRFTI